MNPDRVIEQMGLSPGNCDLHVTIKIVYICMLDRKTSYLIYARTCTVCGSVEIYENYFEMKKVINKRKQNKEIISRGPLYEPGLKGVPPSRSAAATWRAFCPGW